MVNEKIRYEVTEVKAIRGTVAKTIISKQQEGWELVTRQDGRLRTTMTFRRPKPKTPWRLWAALGGAGVILVGIIAVGALLEDGSDAPRAESVAASSTEQPSQVPQAEPAPEPELWAGPTDGSWDYGDVGYGETWEGQLSDYRVTVVGLPEFGPLIDEEVEVTGTFHVERHQRRAKYDSILDDLRFGFTPGNRHWEKHGKDYGLRNRAVCDLPRIAVGDATECRLTFAAPAEEMQDLRWWLNGSSIAAWPGQTTD